MFGNNELYEKLAFYLSDGGVGSQNDYQTCRLHIITYLRLTISLSVFSGLARFRSGLLRVFSFSCKSVFRSNFSLCFRNCSRSWCRTNAWEGFGLDATRAEPTTPPRCWPPSISSTPSHSASSAPSWWTLTPDPPSVPRPSLFG